MSVIRERRALFGIIIIFIAFSSYALYQSRDYIRGPNVKIENISRNGNLFVVSGIAERIAFLSLNGKRIYTDEKGLWQETVLLLPGYNIVEVVAKDRFGREVKTHKDIYF